jgi:hypothetical protein
VTKQFCVNGHDTFEVGRSIWNSACLECERQRSSTYNHSPKGLARRERYASTAKNYLREMRYQAKQRGNS